MGEFYRVLGMCETEQRGSALVVSFSDSDGERSMSWRLTINVDSQGDIVGSLVL